jgi:hypothetical protein
MMVKQRSEEKPSEDEGRNADHAADGFTERHDERRNHGQRKRADDHRLSGIKNGAARTCGWQHVSTELQGRRAESRADSAIAPPKS